MHGGAHWNRSLEMHLYLHRNKSSIQVPNRLSLLLSAMDLRAHDEMNRKHQSLENKFVTILLGRLSPVQTLFRIEKRFFFFSFFSLSFYSKNNIK